MKFTVPNVVLISGAVLFLVGIVGATFDSCEDKACCQSYYSSVVSQFTGQQTCEYDTRFNARPLSIEFAVLGFFLLVATFIIGKGARL